MSTCQQKEKQGGLGCLDCKLALRERAENTLLSGIKWEHYERLQLLSNYHVARLSSVITIMGLSPHSDSVNVMCRNLILRTAIKLNDPCRTVAFQWVEAVNVWREDEESESEKVTVWAE